MADAYKGLTVRLGADTTALSKALRSAKGEVSGVAGELRRLERALKLDPGNAKLLAQQQEDYRRQLASTKKQLDILRQAEREIGKEGMSSEQWTRLQADIAMAEQKVKGYEQALRDSVVQQKALESHTGRLAQALQDFGDKYDAAGKAAASAGDRMAMTVTPAIAATGAAAFQLAADFETSMSQVSGALNDPAADMESLRDLALQLGSDTIFSASECGAAMVELAKGGLTEADIKAGALQTTLDLAAAGELDLADAANTVVQSMGAFGLTADRTGEAANALAGAAAASSADVSDLTQGLSQVSAQANSAGWSIQDTTAVLGAFADAGVTGSDAGTSLKTMLQRLAAPTDKAAAMMESLGVNVRDSNGDMLDAAGVAQELQTKLGGLSSAEKDAAMQTLFGSDASRAALIMTDLGREGIERYTAATNDQTAAQRLAESQMGESERAIEEMKGAVETAAIQIGTALAPVVTDIAGIVGDAAEAFAEMGDEEQAGVIQTAALVAGLGPALSVLGRSVSVVKKAGDGMKSLAGWFAKVSTATDAGTASTKANAAATKAHTVATNLGSAAVGKLNKVMKASIWGLVLSAVGAVVGAIMDFAAANDEAAKRAKEADSANARMKSSLAALDQGYADAKSAAEEYAPTVDDIRKKADDARQAHSDLADSLVEMNSEAGAEAGALQSYVDTVNELGTKSGLTSGEQARLKDAVDRINEACGTSFQVTDDVNGALLNQVDAINAVVDARQEQLRYEAASEGLKDLYKQQEEDLVRISELEQERADLIASKSGKTMAEQRKINEAINENYNALAEARDQYHATSETVGIYEKRIEELGAELGSSSVDLSAFVVSTEGLAAALEGNGQTVDGFATSLSQLGVSTTDLSALSAEQLMQLVSAYDGNLGSITALLDQFGVTSLEEGQQAATNLALGISENAQLAIDAAAAASGQSVDAIHGQLQYFGIEGDEAVTAYANAIAEGKSEAEAAAIAVADEADSGLATGSSEDLGEDYGKGYARGMKSNSVFSAIANSAIALVSSARSSLAAAQRSSSPSKVAALLGGDWGEGYAVGMEGKERRVGDASAVLARSAVMSAGAQRAAGEGAARSVTNDNSTTSSVVNNYVVERAELVEGTSEAAALRTVVDYAARARSAYGK